MHPDSANNAHEERHGRTFEVCARRFFILRIINVWHDNVITCIDVVAVFAGGVAFVSLVVMPAVSVFEVTTFQLVSTALTVTVNVAPAVCAVGVPVLPVGDPGAAVEFP